MTHSIHRPGYTETLNPNCEECQNKVIGFYRESLVRRGLISERKPEFSATEQESI